MAIQQRTARLPKPGEKSVLKLRSGTITTVDGKTAGQRIPLDGKIVTLGSHPDNDIVLEDDAVSRHHACVEDAEEGFRIRDLGSTNGTVVNGIRIESAYLVPGVTVRLGGTTLRFELSQSSCTVDPWPEDSYHGMAGGSLTMRYLFGFLNQVASTPLTVMLLGETGTGKEEAARALHLASPRQNRPFVAFDGASTQPDLMSAALFGQRAGAFTGATCARLGTFQAAHQGTLFIDEVGEIPLALQPMLLRALERREVLPLGSDAAVKVDVRVVCATNRNLEEMVTKGSFRQDLFFRLSGIMIELPPLRDRREDIPVIARRMLESMENAPVLAPSAVDALMARDWPGNVRELRQTLQRAVPLARGPVIEAHHLMSGAVRFGPSGPVLPLSPQSPAARGSLRSLDEQEKESVVEALEATGWSVVLAADEESGPGKMKRAALR